jgi:hypothetical protein
MVLNVCCGSDVLSLVFRYILPHLNPITKKFLTKYIYSFVGGSIVG